MNLKHGAAVLTALVGIAIAAAPASAGPPEMGCFTTDGAEIFPLPSPGADDWSDRARICIGTGDLAHPKPVK